jgi:sugar lactone lactonase YvrE
VRSILSASLFLLTCGLLSTSLVQGQGIITTVAGVNWAAQGYSGPATNVSIGRVHAAVTDSAGNVFVVSANFNNLVFKITPSGTLTKVAGTGGTGFSGDGGPAISARLNQPHGIALDGAGNLYIADTDNERVRKIDSSGIITTVAGTGQAAFSGDGGPAVNAQMYSPVGVAVDAAGNLYIADSNNQRIRKVDPSGIITTVAGNGTQGFSGDGGPATSARLDDPAGIAMDGAGNLYIADSLNFRVRKVNTAGIINTVAGNGTMTSSGDGGPATSAGFGSGPWGIAFDGAGNFYISEGFRVRKVTPAGIISTVAGNGKEGFSGDGGPATGAQLDALDGIAVDGAGNLYIADTLNQRLRKVNSAGIISTFAGNGYVYFSGDGGPATSASLDGPTAVALDSNGNLYIADYSNRRIRKVNSAGTVSTVAGGPSCFYCGDGGPATSADIGSPAAIALDGVGNLYIADSADHVRKVNTAGIISTVAGNGNQGFSGDGGAATSASMINPDGLAVDGTGNLYIADSGNYRIRKVTPAGIISTVAGNGKPGFSGDGGAATSASMNGPAGITVDSTGNLYFTDTRNNRIRKVNSAGIISTVAGNGNQGFSGDGGPATSASLNFRYQAGFYGGGIGLDSAGNLYIADDGNNRIRKVDPSGIITTVAGNGTQGLSGDGGPAASASLGGPTGVALDSNGNLYIADQGNGEVRRVSTSSPGLTSNKGFQIVDRGGASLTSGGAGNSISVGYGQIQPNSGGTTPSGVAIFDFHQNNTLVSEVGVPASPALQSGRIYAEIGGAVDAGLAIANPNSSPATINFYFTDANGNPAGSGSTTVGANQQIAQFLDQSVFKVYTTSTFQGTFSFTSSVPVAVVALRGFTNERGDFLMSTLPVIDTTAAPNTGTTVVPHFADGGGWTTKVLLVNPTDNPMAGTVQFMNQTGDAASVTIGGQANSSFPYSIPPRTSQKLSTAGLGTTTASGSIRIIPAGSGAGPTPLIVFSYDPAGITISEAGVPVTSGSAFRSYVEYSGAAGQAGNIQSGIAVANTSAASANVTFDITDLTGAPVTGISPVTVSLAASGQTAKYVSEIFPSLPNPFKGVLRITTTSSGLSVVGVRLRINERGDLLVTTTPPVNENNPPTSTPMFFPQVADGGGYTTQFILFSGTAGQTTSGTLQLLKQDGSSLSVTLN